MKQELTCVPKQSSIWIPQDKTLHSSWKEKLDQDVQTLNLESYLVRFGKILNIHGFEFSEIGKLSIKELFIIRRSLVWRWLLDGPQ